MEHNFETACVQAGYEPKSGEPRVLPIYQTTTYYYQDPQEMTDLFDMKTNGHLYSRISNPTVAGFEEKLAILEGGVGAIATSSGQSALLVAVMNVCSAGDNIVCSSELYGGSYNLLVVTLKRFGISTTLINPSCTEKELDEAIKPNTKILFGETIANPSMAVLDFQKFAKIAKKHGVLFVVDNTLTTPALCKPFELGANIITHSTTKYLDGHACCVGGAIIDGGNFDFENSKRYPEFNQPDESYHGLVYTKHYGKCCYIAKARTQLIRDLGVSQTAMNAFITNMGAETLHLRMAKHSSNALAVAKALQNHKAVEWVNHPLLDGNKNNVLGKKYLPNGCGGMVSFGIKGSVKEAYEFIRNLKLLKQVTHIADVRSCVLHPATSTHRQLSVEAMLDCGVSENMIRLSIGIENESDIINDIISSLDKIAK